MTDLTESDRASVGRLIVQSSHVDGSVVVELQGELDVESASAFERELARAHELEPREMVIDLGGLTFMDSTGVRLLVGAMRRAGQENYELRLRRLPPQARRVLEMSGALHRFKLSD